MEHINMPKMLECMVEMIPTNDRLITDKMMESVEIFGQEISKLSALVTALQLTAGNMVDQARKGNLEPADRFFDLLSGITTFQSTFQEHDA